MRKLLALMALFVLMVFPVKAQGEVVERLYFVDIIQSGSIRYPDHFGAPRYGFPADIELTGVSWSMMDYGLINQGLIAANVDTVQQTYLQALPDVLTIPLDLETTVTVGTVTAIRNALEARDIPGTWVGIGDTYRVVLREIAGYFQFMQRLTAITQLNPLTSGITLGTQYQNLPVLWQNAIVQAANELNYDASGLTGTTTVRNILRGIASQSGSKVFNIGGYQL